MTRANRDGSYPVYFIVSTQQGRFFVNTGITTCDKLVEMSFPKADANWKRKTVLLAKYFADIETLCLTKGITDMSNTELKARILQEVFGISKKPKSLSLPDVIMDFAATKKEHTAVLYGITSRKVREYASHATLDKIDAEWLESFRLWCIAGGMKINGAGKELRNIRAVFNWARRKGLTQNYPFLDYHIVEEDTAPNNMTIEELWKLREYPCEEWQKPYVDFFFLSFFLAGINPVDLLSLRREDYKDDHISFVRTKTNKQGANKIRTITLPVVKEAKDIIDRYPSKDGYLLSFMDGRADYHSFARQCNKALKKIGTSEIVPDKLGKKRKVEYHPIFPDITLYAARYSFGSIAANDLDISERTIGMCLGHSWSKNVTSRYMASDQRKIDMAVKRVVEYFVSGGDGETATGTT